MKPLFKIFNLFIYTSKQVGQINEKLNRQRKEQKERLDKITELLNQIDAEYSAGINKNDNGKFYVLYESIFNKLNELFTKWENMR